MCFFRGREEEKELTTGSRRTPSGAMEVGELLLLLSRFSCVRLCATPQMAAHKAPPSLEFSRQEHWSGLPFPSPMHESEKWKGGRSVVSDSSRPHGLQPPRLLRPWDLPGKSTGVGCHHLLREVGERVVLISGPVRFCCECMEQNIWYISYASNWILWYN